MSKILAMILSSDAQNRNVGALAIMPALLWRDRKQRQEKPCGRGQLMIYVVGKQETEPHVGWEEEPTSKAALKLLHVPCSKHMSAPIQITDTQIKKLNF